MAVDIAALIDLAKCKCEHSADAHDSGGCTRWVAMGRYCPCEATAGQVAAPLIAAALGVEQ